MIATPHLESMTTTQLAEQLEAARAQTDALFGLLDPAALYERPVVDRHRLVFYLGHLEAFDWNLIQRGELGKPAFDESLDRLFAFGIDPEPGKAPTDRPSDWPLETRVRDYSRRVRREIDESLSAIPDELLHVAIEHRLMHAETLAYLFHNLSPDVKTGPRPSGAPSNPAPANSMVDIPAGAAVLGQSRGDGFGWDNEFERHIVDVPRFQISRYKISNGEYLQYVRSGEPAPHFWVERNGEWFQRTMFGEIPLRLDWPVYVTHAEATAFAQRMGAALPSEAQYHRAAEGTKPVNVDFERWDPIPVDAGAGVSRHGVHQLVGNGWEWTSTVFAPFAGFETRPFYPGYSADFFDGKHFVMKGASPRTAATFLRPSFRNWFRADYPYVYAGFRVVKETGE